jgi:hypothetical protein
MLLWVEICPQFEDKFLAEIEFCRIEPWANIDKSAAASQPVRSRRCVARHLGRRRRLPLLLHAQRPPLRLRLLSGFLGKRKIAHFIGNFFYFLTFLYFTTFANGKSLFCIKNLLWWDSI